MKWNTFLPFTLLLCTYLTGFSQNNFQQGYIIKWNNDSIAGSIDYRNWSKNPGRIIFRDASGKVQEYLPVVIQRFGVAGRTYVGAVASIDQRSDDLNDLKEDPTFMLKTDTVFLETVVSGLKSLYYYNDHQGTPHFYIEKNGDYELLLFKKYLQRSGNNQSIVLNKRYQSQLAVYLFDCGDIQKQISFATYSFNNLLALFNEYYVCKNVRASFKREKEKVHVAFGLLGGAAITNQKFSGSSFPSLTNTDFPSSVDFSGGVFADIILPGALSINNELMYTSYNMNGMYEDYDSENEHSKTSTRIGLSYIKINNMVRFNQHIGGVLLFIDAGVSNGFAINIRNEKIFEFKYYNNEQVIKGPAFDNPRKHEFGYFGGIGGRYQKYSLQTRYERGNGFSDVITIKTSTSRLYFLLGYRF